MQFFKSRAGGFTVIALVYAFVGVYGVICFLGLPYSFWLNLLIADVLATLVIFLFSVLLGNASVYDPYWSVQPLVIAVAFAVKSPVLGAAQILPLIAVILWGVRLTANWAYTFHGLKFQDWRYTLLKEKSGKLYPLVNLFGIHMIPTLVVYGCILPVVFTLRLSPAFNAGSAVFFGVSVAAIILQGAADVQMHAFKKRGGKGFIRKGVWKYSRHPNYFGEIVMWWGIALGAVCIMPAYWYLIAGAAANTLLFAFASVPLADGKQALKPGFAEYKAETRMFLPLPKVIKK